MIISDLHYDRRIYKGIDESRAWGWLMNIVDYHRPDLLLSCGDWGVAVNPEEFYELLRKTVVLTIYGNHEVVNVLSWLYNVKFDKYLPVLMEDGRIYEFKGLRIAGINGIIAKKKKTKKGVPRKTPDEFLAVAEKLKGGSVDLLLMHETPYLPELFPFMRDSFASRTALEAVRIVKPRVVVNGHMHAGCYKVYTFPWGTKYVYISSDQRERCYLILNNVDCGVMEAEIWRNLEKVAGVPGC